jgi:hypothetical protein
VRVSCWPVAIGFAAVSLAGLAPDAAADAPVVLGGGAGIVVEGSYCTLATIGHDHAGELVGFTAGHCGGPGVGVVAEGANNGPVGTVAAVGDGMDYGVIKFDPAKVTPTANFAGFAINGIGPDPDWHQPACTNGAANGTFCGGIASIPGPGRRGGISHAPFQPGDDGGPVTCDNRLIGLVFGGLNTPGDLQGLPPANFTNFTKFSAILNDVNAKGGPGAGFTPIPA